MIAPAHLVPVDRLLDYLPCARCSREGPLRTHAARDGGAIALCEGCREIVEAEAGQGAGEDLSDGLHGGMVPPAATRA